MCQPDDTIGSIKDEISIATRGETKADQMRLILPSQISSSSSSSTSDNRQKKQSSSQSQQQVILEDDSQRLEEYKIENEMELHVVFQISEDEWEAVTIETLPGGTAAATAVDD